MSTLGPAGVGPAIAYMLVSVVIPAFNREKTISRAVRSVLIQTYKSIELIVVDDGSTDGTVAALRQFGDRIRIICQPNKGPGAARNAGIRASSGEIISFLDSDDEWLPEKTERQLNLMARTSRAGVRCCVCNARLLGRGKSEMTSFQEADLAPPILEGIWTNPVEMLLTRFLLFNQVVAVSRAVLDDIGLFNEEFRILEDYEMALRLAMTGPWGFIADPLVIYHSNSEGSLSKDAKEFDVLLRTRQILTHLDRTAGGQSGLPRRLLRQRQRLLARRIWARRVAEGPDRVRAGLGKALLWGLRLEKWLYYRLPSCPRMLVADG